MATLDVTGPHRKHETALRDLIMDRMNSAICSLRMAGLDGNGVPRRWRSPPSPQNEPCSKTSGLAPNRSCVSTLS